MEINRFKLWKNFHAKIIKRNDIHENGFIDYSMNLLIPSEELMDDINNLGGLNEVINNEQSIELLADKFNVDKQIIIIIINKKIEEQNNIKRLIFRIKKDTI